MGKRIYKWKRFWVKREGEFNLSDGGYLTDPDTELGRFYNRGAIALSTIARSPCLVLLGEPGIGKSTAIKSEFDALETKIRQKGCSLTCGRSAATGSSTASYLGAVIFKVGKTEIIRCIFFWTASMNASLELTQLLTFFSKSSGAAPQTACI